MKANTKSLTSGSIISALTRLSIPIVLANVLQTAYQLIDTFRVGRLGQDAVAAVSLSFPLIFLLIALGSGFTIAGTILVAQNKGKGDSDAVDRAAGQTFFIMIVISLVLSVIGYFAAPWIISRMGASPAVYDQAVGYLQTSFIGLLFLFGFFIFQSLMRGVGDADTPLYIIGGTVVLNFFLDPLFIFGYGFVPGMGVQGAALATVITQGLAAIVGTLILLSGKYDIHVRLKNLKPNLSLLKTMFHLGLPTSIDFSARALGLTAMTTLVATFGTATTAAYGIGIRVLTFVIIPAMGLSMAASTLVGQNIGAGQPDRATHTANLSARIGFVILTLIGIIVFFTAPAIAGVFLPGETQAIASSADFIRIMALSFGFIGGQLILNGAFMGAGNTRVPMIITIVALRFIEFPVAYGLSKHTTLGEAGIRRSFPIANVLAGLIAFLYFRSGKRQRKALTDNEKLERSVHQEATIEMIEENVGA